MNRHTRRTLLKLPAGAFVLALLTRCTPGTGTGGTLTLAEIISDMTDIVNGLIAEAPTLENLLPGSAAAIKQIIAGAQAALAALQSVTSLSGASGIVSTIIALIPQLLQMLQAAGVTIPASVQAFITMASTLASIILPFLGLAVPAAITAHAQPAVTREQAKIVLQGLVRR
jgi:hypothetical protein